MKSCLLPLALLTLAAAAPFLRAADEVSAVSLRVEEVSNDKFERFAETQKKPLKVFLTNGSAVDAAVKLKYYYFAKDIKDSSVIVFKEGEKPATVKAHADLTVEIPAVTANSTEKHAATASRTHSSSSAKAVKAGGDKIIGYGVQVIQGGKVLSDYFSEPSLKSNVGGTSKDN